MIGHVVSGQSLSAPDAYLAFCCGRGEKKPLAFLKARFSQGSRRTDSWKMMCKVIKNPD